MRNNLFRCLRSIVLVLFIGIIGAPMNRSISQDSSGASTPKVELSGFVDAYYSKNFAGPSSRINRLRNFDIAEDQFNLSLAELVVQKKAGPVGFRFDLDFGPTNDLVQPGNGSTGGVLQQGYLTANVPLGEGLTIDAGKFVTHMGYEVIESKDNANYSRSFMFAYAIPYYHTGVRLTYPIASNVTAALHIVNGWNSGFDNNDSKSFGVMLNYAPVSSTAAILNIMTGHENLTPAEYGARNVCDFILTHQLSEVFALALNADYGEAQTSGGLAIWKGAAAYGRYVISQKYSAALRAEIFDDPQGYATGLGTPKLDVKEVTGTYEYKFAETLVLRAELRYDWSNAPAFDKKAGSAGPGIGTESAQTTILIGAVATF